VSGGGIKILENARIVVHTGECEAEALAINEGFCKYITSGLPFVIAKWAMTLDGRMATRTGSSRWVTGEIARERVHCLRDVIDAIVIGVGTVVSDNPQLTARPSLPTGRAERTPRLPLRVVLDSRGRIPLSCRLVSPEMASGTLVVVTEKAGPKTLKSIKATGAQLVVLPESREGIDLSYLLPELARRGLVNVLLEAAPTLLGSFLSADLVDKVWAFIAPKMVGGGLVPAACWSGVEHMSDALMLQRVDIEHVGGDILIQGYLPERE
jgi:diaminohydroxyphosphoribosylaminopyrimidine deaminase / 5-amino-6-(5-phosphoribosylamino)uracil reductase